MVIGKVNVLAIAENPGGLPKQYPSSLAGLMIRKDIMARPSRSGRIPRKVKKAIKGIKKPSKK